jgi:mRNA interferase HigB
MRVIARHNLIEFAERNPRAMASVDRWYGIARRAVWTSPEAVVAAFSGAKAIDGERDRFELHGGAFRLIVAFDFRRQIAFIKFLGTHAEYDRIDARTVSMF